MLNRSCVAAFIITFFISVGIALASDAYNERLIRPEQTVYTVQIGSFPMTSKFAVIRLYEQLKKEGYPVFYRRIRIENGEWVRVKIGWFDTKPQAIAYRDSLLSQKYPEAFIVQDHLPIQTLGEKRCIVTPTDIWLETAGGKTDLFHFDHNLIDDNEENDDWNYYTQPFFAPSGDKVIFEYQSQIVTIQLENRLKTVLDLPKTESGDSICVHNSFPQESPLGHYLALIDNNLWEANSGLWLYARDSLKVLIPAGKLVPTEAVKNFRWHPEKDLIFFINGFAMGTVTVGGDLYATDVHGNCMRLITGDKEKREEIAIDFTLDQQYLYYQIAQHDSSYSSVIRMSEEKAPLANLVQQFEMGVKKKLVPASVPKPEVPKPETKEETPAAQPEQKTEKKTGPLDDFLQ